MAQTQKRALVIVRNSEIFYIEERITTIVKLINQPYLEDLETIDTEVLTKSLNLWKEKNKGIKLQILVIFSDDVLFKKTFKNDDQEIEQKVGQYLDKVPFDKLIYRHYENRKETDLVVISRDFFETIIECFEGQGFEVVNTIPEQLLKANVKYEEYNAEATKKIINKFDYFRNPKFSLNNKSMTRIKKKYQVVAKNSTTLIILAGMLTALIATFLLILFMQSYFNIKTTSDNNAFKQQVAVPTIPDPNDLIKTNLNVEISYYKGASESAGLLKNNLEINKFKNIVLTVDLIKITNPIITFPNNLSKDIQNEIIDKVGTLSESLLIKHDVKIENIVKISL